MNFSKHKDVGIQTEGVVRSVGDENRVARRGHVEGTQSQEKGEEEMQMAKNGCLTKQMDKSGR